MLYFSPKTICSLCLVFAGLGPVSARTISSADSSQVARIYQTTLDIIYDKGEVSMDSLLHYSAAGLRLAKKYRLLTFVSDFNTNIAYGYKRAGDYEKAAYHSSLAYKEALALNYIAGIARSGYTHAMICFDKGDIKPSFHQISLNLEFARENKLDRYMFVNYYLLSHINSHTNNRLITDYYMEKAFRFHSDSTLLQAFQTKNELQWAIMQKEDQEKLYKKFRSLILQNKDNAQLEEIILLIDIANTYAKSGNTQKAIEIFEELIRMKLKHVEYPETTLYANLAAVYLKTHQFKKAEITNPKADRSIVQLYNYNDYLTILKTEAVLKEHKGLHREALKTWKEIYSLEDSLVHTKNEISYLLVTHLKNLESLESKFEFVNKENAMQRLLLEKERREKALLSALALLLIILCGVVYRLFRKLSVSTQKILEQNKAISAQTESLRESNLIKDKLFSLLSHELRSPVAELITILDVNEWKNKDSALDPYFKSVNLRAKTIYTTLDNVLTWSASQLDLKKTEVKPLDISDVVNRALHLSLSSIYQKNIRVDNEVAHALIDANESYLMIIFRNILNNATKFTLLNGVIRIYSVEEGNYSGVVVEDSGVGIDPEKLRSLFVNVQNSSEGTEGEKGSGVGLVLCKDLMDKLQGKIEVLSSENQGTSVKLLFKKAGYFQV